MDKESIKIEEDEYEIEKCGFKPVLSQREVDCLLDMLGKNCVNEEELKEIKKEAKMVKVDEDKVVINPPEKKRVYSFLSGKELVRVELNGVEEIVVRLSGTHRLKTTDGKRHIIPPGWVHIELDIDEWSL